jgi:hypothetical protein
VMRSAVSADLWKPSQVPGGAEWRRWSLPYLPFRYDHSNDDHKIINEL